MTNVIAYTAIDMINPVVWYGTLTSYDASHITISDGFHTGTYYGSFTYDIGGNVYGTLTGYSIWQGITLSVSITGASVNAHDVFLAIQSGNAAAAAMIALAGNDTIQGSSFADSLTGHDGADKIYGNGGGDYIYGGAGLDVLNGSAGADTVFGDLGNDRILGGVGADALFGSAGADTLVGGAGSDMLNGGFDSLRDVFKFNFASESVVGIHHDRIQNFVHGTDKIDLNGIDANTATDGNAAFAFGGTVAAGYSIWFAAVSGGIVVRGDIDGNTTADFEVFVASVASVTASDFVL